MTKETQQLCEEMEKLSSRISEDLKSTLVSLSGSLKGIECGTHIKIPTDVGYVNYYKSVENTETITCYLKDQLLSPKKDSIDDEYQEYLDDIEQGTNTTKSN